MIRFTEPPGRYNLRENEIAVVVPDQSSAPGGRRHVLRADLEIADLHMAVVGVDLKHFFSLTKHSFGVFAVSDVFASLCARFAAS